MKKEHTWDYCSLCDTMMVICGTCGNNSCNGTYGELEDGSTCPDCESAYVKQDTENPPPYPRDRILQLRKHQKMLEDVFGERSFVMRSDQVAYIPLHLNGDILHPDVEFGFVSEVREGLCRCHFWEHGTVDREYPSDAILQLQEKPAILPTNSLVRIPHLVWSGFINRYLREHGGSL